MMTSAQARQNTLQCRIMNGVTKAVMQQDVANIKTITSICCASATGNAGGNKLWRKMFKYFKEHRQEFLEHYHKRSNSETVFFMLKQKRGGSLMTKTFTAQKNEIPTKILIHNLLVLIQEYFEQGLEIDLSTEAKNLQELKVKW